MILRALKLWSQMLWLSQSHVSWSVLQNSVLPGLPNQIGINPKPTSQVMSMTRLTSTFSAEING